MRRALLGGDAGPAAAAIAGDGIDPAARLDVYRHHVLATLTAALESTYPVVCRLVDRRFFGYAADAYVREHPPAGPCLFEYGEGFADFLAAFPPCRGLPYLPDVARLEWSMNAALHAEDTAPIDPAELAAVPPDALPRLTLAIEPSVSLLASPWPVDRIWRANQEGADEPAVDLDAGGVRLEIRRTDGAVGMRALDAATHGFRAALAAGRPLGHAAEAALALDPRFDLAGALRDFLEERILTGFAVSNG
jgi:hypothetical protein